MNLSIVKNVYLMATIAIASLFVAMFFTSGQWFCLIPAVFTIADFFKTTREARATRNIDMRIIRASGTPIAPIEIEFISEEEFKV